MPAQARAIAHRSMTETRSDTVSVAERARRVAAEAPVVAAHFLGRTAVFVLGEEALLLVEPQGDPRRVAVHGGAILATAADGERVVSGGDDGKVVDDEAAGREPHARDRPETPLDRSHRARRRTAPSPGRPARRPSCRSKAAARIRSALDRRRPRLSAERLSACGRALQRRHAVVSQCAAGGAGNARMEGLASRRDGQSRRPLSRHHHAGADAARLAARRPQAHAHVRLCGARDLARLDRRRPLARDLRRDATHPLAVPDAKTGRWASSRACWRRREHRVEVVACHPKQDFVAAGYADGLVLIVRIEDGAEILAKKPGDAPVTALAWSADGMLLAFGTESGEAGVIDLA